MSVLRAICLSISIGGCSIATGGCGGSSSETPPPLEPLPRRGELARTPPAPAPPGDTAGRRPEIDQEAPPAPATWGGGAEPAAGEQDPGDAWLLK